ncbi:hypothetical protein V6615_16320 (plasmid) [Oscillospiraceae bacterium PP1C4]
MGEKKDISRSVRMTQEVYDYIMTFGDEKGFNANLEKAVLFMKYTVPNHEKKLADYKKELAVLNLEILERKGTINHSLTNIQQLLDDALQEAMKMSHK